MGRVRLVSITPEAESVILYCARVSSPQNQSSESTALLRYCAQHSHWSIFEMANMVVEVETSRAISAQILRHRSFTFQEFSQRYAQVQHAELYYARRQDRKNRQNSLDDMDQADKDWFLETQRHIHVIAFEAYDKALERGIAKEQARFLLPMSASTRLYINGTIRSWIHYLQLRTGHGTQLEHQEIARAIQTLFVDQLPTISEALGWNNS